MFDGFSVVLVEDDPPVRHSLAQTLELAGFAVAAHGSAEEALATLSPGFLGVLITDVRLPRMDGITLLTQALRIEPALPVILITAHGDVGMAVQAMRAGAYDFIEKPFAPERLVDVVTRALDKRSLSVEVQSLRQELAGRRGVEAMLLGRSTAMQTLQREVQALAATSADVMIIGETGTGKELVARCLHEHSTRRARNFVAINCGGLPETLLESELFGHEAGAFTSAQKRRVGKIEHADGGTLLLDEIESMPLTFQVKLLRVLQERRLERLGSNDELSVDIRVIAATKADLKAMSDQHKFRGDLYYRLNVAVLELPPLRERREDIPLLFDHFVMQAAARHGREPPAGSGALNRRLMAHDWPGNVRELRNAAERFVLGLGRDSLPAAGAPDKLALAEQMDQVEKALIEQSLKAHRGVISATCEALGIARKTLYDKLARHGIVADEFRGGPAGE
ncbi:sigma-54-dependent Fis family transcriptional regulator [Aquincola sp. S2]|uniref:Sigma-54-dependent Fis family transcriptional regulator n=1 Tax=Pseudaquabacterium terrae TaxID=2732868 RepID=A0ABX2ENM1_9BURK|nr:sigma-54 dependent transcriptional regulator [Aquabacterium terrae]NRF70246.1 sigma-54-dependent Fis family transcriptional regulator [Aquabacterium terrae]